MKLKNHKDTLKFALFISLLNSLYKSVLCIMRRFCQNDKINAAVAGAISSLSLLADAKDRRIFFALVLFSRAIVILQHIKQLKDIFLNVLKKRGLNLRFKYGEVFVWAVMGCFNKYLMSYEPECLNPSFRAFYWTYSQMTRNDFDLLQLWMQQRDNGLP